MMSPTSRYGVLRDEIGMCMIAPDACRSRLVRGSPSPRNGRCSKIHGISTEDRRTGCSILSDRQPSYSGDGAIRAGAFVSDALLEESKVVPW